MAGWSRPCVWRKSLSQEEQHKILKLGAWGLVSNGYVGKRLKWQMRKVGIWAQKLWMIAEQAPNALQPEWEDKPSSVSQQQLEKKEYRWNKMESVSLHFWKSGLWQDMRGLGEKEWNESWAWYTENCKRWRKKGKGKKSPFLAQK